MLLLINPYSAGGSAISKWKRIEHFVARSVPKMEIHSLDGKDRTSRLIGEALSAGETDFVAAGGDGTVNFTLNCLLDFAMPGQLAQLRLGAIGLGSSNDFHKPFRLHQVPSRISCKLDFSRSLLRDVGCLTYDTSEGSTSVYFLINASCGLTAEANSFFNNPDRFLRQLKRLNTPTAIVYAATKTILKYRNIPVHLDSGAGKDFTTPLTNLGVLKSPHFSGSLRYDTPNQLDSGQFIVTLCSDMTRWKVFHLFQSLSKGQFEHMAKTRSWGAQSLAISAEKPFAIEFDGEVTRTTTAKFTILPRHLKVCP